MNWGNKKDWDNIKRIPMNTWYYNTLLVQKKIASQQTSLAHSAEDK